MKRFLILGIIFVFIFALVGCGQRNEADMEIESTVDVVTDLETEEQIVISGSFEPATLRFSSLEEFLVSYLEAMSGRARGGTLSTLEESVNLLSLERFYLPVNIPEEYKLFRILVDEYHVSLWFLPEEHLGSEMDIINATVFEQHFLLSVTRRLNLENPMAGVLEQSRITEADLIDGKYYFDGWNLFIWGSNGEILMLYTPVTPVVGLMDTVGEDIVRFTEMYTLDLTDEDAIRAILSGQNNYGDGVTTWEELKEAVDAE